MHFGLRLGFVALSALVGGCSGPTVSPQDEGNPGEESPAQSSDPATQKKPAATSTNAPGSSGAPVPYPNGAGAAPTTPVTARSTMTFFVTSTGSGALGGNLGGLTGADKKCQDLAAAANAGDHTWHAYLSVLGTNAKDRIGPGPWKNQKGTLIAQDLVALHDFQFIPLTADLVDEKGAAVPVTATSMLTGTKSDGTALLQTCQNWTSNANNETGRLGDAASETSNVLGVRWNDAVKSSACSQQNLGQNKSEGRLYCFAVD
jgi:hypothetical protein